MCVLNHGKIGETFNIGGCNEIKNIDIATMVCRSLDNFKPDAKGSYKRLIKFVADRPGHDRRYSIDASKIKNELGWYPKETFETGLHKTIEWYLANQDWTKSIETKNLDGQQYHEKT
jgi:dTDP-glucose 4,6-dehydratase